LRWLKLLEAAVLSTSLMRRDWVSAGIACGSHPSLPGRGESAQLARMRRSMPPMNFAKAGELL
jgi:hypothetical protein